MMKHMQLMLVVKYFVPKPLADQLGLDPATLADQLEQLHEQGNALADLLTQ